MSIFAILCVALSGNLACDDAVLAPPAGDNVEVPGLSGEAELPRVYVDLEYPQLSGNIISVGAGDDLQAALNSASAGDVVELQAGATFTGAFVLPRRSDEGYVVIRSSGIGNLAKGERVSLADTVRMARIMGGGSNKRTLLARSGAAGYWLEGVDIVAQPSSLPGVLNALVEFEPGSERIVMDRVIVRGRADTNMQRCVIVNGAHLAVTNSWVGECHAVGFDSQAIVGWKGGGPIHIENNYLAGAGENVMFGGAQIGAGEIPSDIVIRRNHIHKPLEWKGKWTVKNLLELKFGRRFLIEGNVLENMWAGAQVGFAVNIKSENRDLKNGRMDVATTDVTFRDNQIRNSRFGVTLIPQSSSRRVEGAAVTSRIHFENNDIPTIEGRGIQSSGIVDLTLIHNSVPNGGLLLEGTEHVRLTLVGNVVAYVKGSGIPAGNGAFRERAPGADVRQNVFLDGKADYPVGNTVMPAARYASYQGSAGLDRARLEAAINGVANDLR